MIVFTRDVSANGFVHSTEEEWPLLGVLPVTYIFNLRGT